MLNNKTILMQMFYGELYPSENIGRNSSPELKKSEKILSAANDDFMKLLCDTDRVKFRELLELRNQNTGIHGAECFAYGFRLGMRLLLEVLPDGDILTQLKSELSNENSDNAHTD